jgi:CubicO group peptidase (beta-lactamase class C family)
MPGGVVIIGHNGAVVYRKAFGSRSLEPAHEAMTADTIFDLASLTNVIATTTAVMQLLDEGRIRLNDPVAAYLPGFAQNGKGQITVRELLTHFSGLPPDLDLKAAWQGRDTAYNMAMQARPMVPPGTRFFYSDINFEVLGFIVEKISGVPLNEYTSTHVFAPLGMTETTFLPLAGYLNAREIDGVRFVPTNFTPNASNYANQTCGGVNIIVTNREALDGPELGLEIAAALEHLYPNDFKIAGIDGLMRNKATLDALTAGEDPRRIAEDWQDALKSFETVRAKYLLY